MHKGSGRNQAPYASSAHAEKHQPQILQPGLPCVPIDGNHGSCHATRRCEQAVMSGALAVNLLMGSQRPRHAGRYHADHGAAPARTRHRAAVPVGRRTRGRDRAARRAAARLAGARGTDAALLQAQQLVAGHDGFEGELPLLIPLHTLVLCHLGRYREALAQAERGVAVTEDARRTQLPRARLRLAQCWWHLGQWLRVAQLLDTEGVDDAGDVLARILQARLRLAGLRVQRDRGPARAQAVATLRRELEALGASGDLPHLRHALRIELATDDEPAAALRELAAVADEARRIGHLGTARAAHLRAAAAAIGVDAGCARREALAALALADQGCCDTLLLPGELWLHAGRALQAAGDPRAQQVLGRGAAWVQDTARRHVPEACRDGFLYRNPVNHELLSLAARAAAG